MSWKDRLLLSTAAAVIVAPFLRHPWQVAAGTLAGARPPAHLPHSLAACWPRWNGGAPRAMPLLCGGQPRGVLLAALMMILGLELPR